MSRKINMYNIPNTSYTVGNMYIYDYKIHKWIYDVKYYLNGDNWSIDLEGKDVVREAREQELKMVEKHKKIIDECERENTAWLAHEQCRKRSCACKKCEKYCHCYNCDTKISKCAEFAQLK